MSRNITVSKNPHEKCVDELFVVEIKRKYAYITWVHMSRVGITRRVPKERIPENPKYRDIEKLYFNN